MWIVSVVFCKMTVCRYVPCVDFLNGKTIQCFINSDFPLMLANFSISCKDKKTTTDEHRQ